MTKLTGHYGYSTHILFSAHEKVGHIAMGDAEAWAVSPLDNHIFIKPKGDDPATNMTVVTDKRIYNFELSAHESKSGAWARDMQFEIRFRYPHEEAERKRNAKKKRLLEEKLAKEPHPSGLNWNYWAKGSADLTPKAAYDDGRFTYLSFSGNRSVPAIYAVEGEDGEEALVNTHIDPKRPNAIVVHGVYPRLVLRKGKAVTCAFNKSYDPEGKTSGNGTTRKGVKRAIKGTEK